MASVLERSLRGGATIDDLKLTLVDYRPGSGATVAYQVTVGDEQHTAVANAGSVLCSEAVRTDTRRAIARVLGRSDSPIARPLTYDVGLGALVQWYPLDLAMPVLARPVPELLRQVARSGIAVDARGGSDSHAALPPRPARRRARRRRRAQGVRRGRVVPRRRRGPAHRGQPRARPRTAAPRRARRPAPHRAGGDRRRPGAAQPARARSRRSPARCCASCTTPRSPASRPRRPARCSRRPPAAPRSPRRSPRTSPAASRNLLARLEEHAPEPAQPRRLPRRLQHQPVPRLRGRARDPRLRRGVPRARARSTSPPTRRTSWAAAPATSSAPTPPSTRCSAGYGERPEHVDWYLAALLLRRAPSPFRLHKKRWPQRLESMVAAAEEVLGR